MKECSVFSIKHTMFLSLFFFVCVCFGLVSPYYQRNISCSDGWDHTYSIQKKKKPDLLYASGSKNFKECAHAYPKKRRKKTFLLLAVRCFPSLTGCFWLGCEVNHGFPDISLHLLEQALNKWGSERRYESSELMKNRGALSLISIDVWGP